MAEILYKRKNNKIVRFSPTSLIVSSFAALVLIGSLLLWLPVASSDGQSVRYVDALFTATAASCVTGLIVVDTGTHWSLFGQIVILCLIQAGGLGIVTLTTFLYSIMGKKLSLKGMLLAQESLNYFTFEGVTHMVKNVILAALGIELVGAVLLSVSFVPEYGPRGIYMGIFHSVSAFCNAGMDIIGGYKNLVEYNDNPMVLYTIAILIFIGGLGFIVWKDLYDFRKTRNLYLHTKVVLMMSGFLTAFGAIFFFIFEHDNPLTMGALSLPEKINAALFHSISARTAGFNSLPLNGMRDITKAATIMLMFIGAAPGSTGGGVKVTTISVLWAAVISQVRGLSNTVILRRRISQNIVNKALTIVVLSIGIIVIAAAFLMVLEDASFIDILFEAVSCFSTAGMSTGITPVSHDITKALFMITMFFGRVGPLSFAIALSIKANRKDADMVYPEGKIMVG